MARRSKLRFHGEAVLQHLLSAVNVAGILWLWEVAFLFPFRRKKSIPDSSNASQIKRYDGRLTRLINPIAFELSPS